MLKESNRAELLDVRWTSSSVATGLKRQGNSSLCAAASSTRSLQNQGKLVPFGVLISEDFSYTSNSKKSLDLLAALDGTARLQWNFLARNDRQ